MSLDYYVCDKCQNVTVNYCVRCENCGRTWCSDECASEDGHRPTFCDKYEVFGDDEVELCRKIHKCEYDDCIKCDYLVPESCKYCREEDFEDYKLLKYALQLLNMTRQELIDKIKEE